MTSLRLRLNILILLTLLPPGILLVRAAEEQQRLATDAFLDRVLLHARAGAAEEARTIDAVRDLLNTVSAFCRVAGTERERLRPFLTALARRFAGCEDLDLPKAVAFAAFNQALRRHLALLGLVLVLAVAAGWWGSDRLVIRRKGLRERLDGYTNQSFRPFDPVSKRTGAVAADAGGDRCEVSKGAPQAVLNLVGEGRAALAADIAERVDALAEKGCRALGVARRKADGGEWEYVGLLSLFDPPRSDSAATIETAGSMDVAVKMVTGDHLAIARETARRVGLGTRILTAESATSESGERELEYLESADGFAQVFPEHKYEIVEALQNGDHIVGMTGDGVNDAPALKKADVGIAVAMMGSRCGPAGTGLNGVGWSAAGARVSG